MDKAYEGDDNQLLAQSLNFKPIVSPQSNQKIPWIFDKILYKSRNKIERLFRKIKRFIHTFTRYYKLDPVFLFFIENRAILSTKNSAFVLYQKVIKAR